MEIVKYMLITRFERGTAEHAGRSAVVRLKSGS
jgi:hypothetical protein